MKTFFFALVFFTLLMTSCKKGDTGSAGPLGPQGAQGAQGIPGKNGAVIHSGSGVPATALGNNGDMYLDIVSSNLYGPKTDAGWGTPLNLKGQSGANGTNGTNGTNGAPGATGPAGTAGSKILSGTAAPATALGVIGDYYLNKTTGDLYGPKNASSWGTPINLRGAANVVASPWLSYTWSDASTTTHLSMNYSIPAPALNAVGYSSLQAFFNGGGTILVYAKYEFDGVEDHVLLNFYGSTLNIRFYFRLSPPETMTILMYSESTVFPDWYYSSAMGAGFRYVLIAPGQQLSASSARTALSKMSYNEAMKMLNIIK